MGAINMKKPFLLIINDLYYPDSGTGDWEKCFKSLSDAEKYGQAIVEGCGDDKYYTVVDLRDWTEREEE